MNTRDLKKRIKMNIRIAVFCSILLVGFAGEKAAADEIVGQVGAVSENQIAIIVNGDLQPQAGDRFTVAVDVPGVGQAVIAEGQVIKMDGDVAIGLIDSATGKIAEGHLVRIDSPRPIREMRLMPEIIGQIGALVGQDITIVTTSQTPVAVGDRVEVVAEIPNVGRKSIGTGQVSALQNGLVAARVEQLNGKLAFGQQVAITPAGSTTSAETKTQVTNNPQAEIWLGIYLDNHRDFVRVRAVIPGSPAAKAGVLAGDRLKSIDEIETTSRAAAFTRFGKMPPGSQASLEVIRSGASHSMVLVPEPRITDEQLFAMMNLMAAKDNPIAAHEVGMMLWRGQGVPAKNPREAIRWLRIAANGGHVQGQFQAGFMLIYGEGIEANPTEGVEWIRRAAEQGDPDAVLLLARLYQSGFGVQQSDSEARRWFQVSVDQGTLAGMVDVARLYRDGVLFEKNEQLAVELFRTAAERDLAVGQREWGLCLRDGVGVERAPDQAADWLRLAASAGDKPARAELEAMGEPLVKNTQHVELSSSSATPSTPSSVAEPRQSYSPTNSSETNDTHAINGTWTHKTPGDFGLTLEFIVSANGNRLTLTMPDANGGEESATLSGTISRKDRDFKGELKAPDGATIPFQMSLAVDGRSMSVSGMGETQTWHRK